MINAKQPDFANTPASQQRPDYRYAPRDDAEPLVSIITPYYNTGPVFWETARCVRRMSLAHWEWLIVDDGSTDAESLAQLARLCEAEPRVRVIRQPNGGPAVARNRAVAEARGKYLLQLDSDDMVEPTFAEKAAWLLETQPQFAAANGYNVTFGSKNFLWSSGFHEYDCSIDDNRVTSQAVIRREAYLAVGGYDERISYEHADWDFWLTLAGAGLWGYTIPEYLTWYRTQERSLLVEIESDERRARAFRAWLQAKHAGLRGRFPRPHRDVPGDQRYATVRDDIPLRNPLEKPAGTRRILLLVPWLEMGGADTFNLDLVGQLSDAGHEFTIATTAPAADRWLHRFAAITPDIFCLHRFLNMGDYPRFLRYLIESRQIDAVVLSNSELGYRLLPYLRAHYPHLALLDYNHMEEPGWLDGGYPAMSARCGSLLDRQMTCTGHLREWMIARGANPNQVQVCYCGLDASQWDPDAVDTALLRRELGVGQDEPLLLFAGRMVEQKRPLLFGEIMSQLARRTSNFTALAVGDGPERRKLERFVRRHGLSARIRVLGEQSPERVRELMAAADILVQPSAHEGLALVLYEAMAMRTVPVAADVGGQAELVAPDRGVLIPRDEREREAYVAAIQRLLHDDVARRAMAEHARRRVQELFSSAAMRDAMTRAIAEAMDHAAERAEQGVDLAVAHGLACQAIEELSRVEAVELLWHLRGARGYVAFLRAVRQRVFPIGSARYARYRLLRQTLRRGAQALRVALQLVLDGAANTARHWPAAR